MVHISWQDLSKSAARRLAVGHEPVAVRLPYQADFTEVALTDLIELTQRLASRSVFEKILRP